MGALENDADGVLVLSWYERLDDCQARVSLLITLRQMTGQNGECALFFHVLQINIEWSSTAMKREGMKQQISLLIIYSWEPVQIKMGGSAERER
jgi:hypothetical protein